MRFILGHQSRGRTQSPEEKSKRSASMKAALAERVKRITCGHTTRRHYGNGMCHSCWVTEWYKRNPDKQIGSASWAKRNPERMKELSRKASLLKHGLTPESFNQLWNSQQGKCANPRCTATFEKSAMNRKRNGLHIDHDHKSGKIRGLLCPRCNTALGHVGDRADILLGLIEYLKKFEVLN